eukprot:234324-Amphidinium_carterae.2
MNNLEDPAASATRHNLPTDVTSKGEPCGQGPHRTHKNNTRVCKYSAGWCSIEYTRRGNHYQINYPQLKSVMVTHSRQWDFISDIIHLRRWTHWDLNPGPPACEADVIPLHRVPMSALAKHLQSNSQCCAALARSFFEGLPYTSLKARTSDGGNATVGGVAELDAAAYAAHLQTQ